MELVIKSFEELTKEELVKIYQARVKVFVVEQNCPYQEIDDKDFASYHLFYLEDGEILAYLRVLPANLSFSVPSIGRVISLRRGEGLASKLMLEGFKVAIEKFNASKIQIEAQVQAKGFYESLGFYGISEEFMDDGIMHLVMEKCF